MVLSQLEKRLTMISTGRLPSQKLLELGASRPFVHQAWSTTSSLVATHVEHVEIRSKSSFLSIPNSTLHSELLKLVTVPRVLRCPRYTKLSTRTIENQVFLGALSRTFV